MYILPHSIIAVSHKTQLESHMFQPYTFPRKNEINSSEWKDTGACGRKSVWRAHAGEKSRAHAIVQRFFIYTPPVHKCGIKILWLPIPCDGGCTRWLDSPPAKPPGWSIFRYVHFLSCAPLIAKRNKFCCLSLQAVIVGRNLNGTHRSLC